MVWSFITGQWFAKSMFYLYTLRNSSQLFFSKHILASNWNLQQNLGSLETVFVNKLKILSRET